MKKIVSLLLVVAVSMSLFGCGAKDFADNKTVGKTDAGVDKGSISVYNWGDYMDETLLEKFTEETGITVAVYDTFASNEDMYTKMKSGGANYDVLFPSDYMIEKMINEDMLDEINFENIPNYKNIDERFINLPFDPNSKHSVPYMWGTLGILYNKTMVTDPVDSWSILWNEKYKGQIFMYDSMRDSLAVALKLLGYSLNTKNIDELNQAKDTLIKQKPLVQANVDDMVKDKMIGAEGALAVVYSGDATYCIEQNPDLAYAVPKEGSNVWFDGAVIPKGAKNKAGAEAFINFLNDGDNALKNTEYIGFSTTNKAAFEKLSVEKQTDPCYWPTDEIYNNCEVFLDLGDFVKEYDKTWTEILVSN